MSASSGVFTSPWYSFIDSPPQEEQMQGDSIFTIVGRIQHFPARQIFRFHLVLSTGRTVI
jgi:hypothetical protein